MKKLVLIAVLLQLCLSVLEVTSQPQFGDLIEFPKFNIFGKNLYSHYAIYVGDEPFQGKTPHQNIFEMIRKPPGCRFSNETGPFTIRNDYFNEKTQTVAQMRETIEALMRPDSGRCKKYSLDKENCEMVATLVRYGKAMCKQENTIMAGAAKRTNPRKKRHEASAAA